MIHTPAAILLVDDDVLALEMLRDLVSSIPGTAVHAFGSAEAALEWCRTHQPDVVITDHVMPGLTGLELIRELRAGPDTADVPVMMVTATGDRGLRFQALESGASDVLGKPLDGTEVLARTRNMLAIRRGQRLDGAVLSCLSDPRINIGEVLWTWRKWRSV